MNKTLTRLVYHKTKIWNVGCSHYGIVLVHCVRTRAWVWL